MEIEYKIWATKFNGGNMFLFALFASGATFSYNSNCDKYIEWWRRN